MKIKSTRKPAAKKKANVKKSAQKLAEDNARLIEALQNIADTYRQERNEAIVNRNEWRHNAYEWQMRFIKLKNLLEEHGIPMPEDL
jgi:hypothetical protein